MTAKQLDTSVFQLETVSLLLTCLIGLLFPETRVGPGAVSKWVSV